MRPIESIRPRLAGLDGKDYGAYQSLKGAYLYPDFELHIDRIPKDPYAPPHTGIYRVRVEREPAGFPLELCDTDLRRVAFCDYLTRQIRESCEQHSRRRGTGYSGIITIAQPGQEVLERTSVAVDERCIEARVFLGLPASNRIIRAETAARMIFTELPQVVASSLFSGALDMDAFDKHLRIAEDAEYLRAQLPEHGLAAFVAEGSVLPRRSGVDSRPLDEASAAPFRSPESLRRSFQLPNSGMIEGLGIPQGVTLLVGGGYHGKSTLLQAIEQGVYNHVTGDGRELVVSLPETVKVRSCSGRYVTGTDISPFIRNIPRQRDTTAFSSVNASGSTSQAAFISEAIEAGAKLLLMDEDTCATNFLIRDHRMQQLVRKEHEPITAFIDGVRRLFVDHGISTILVLGGSGDYLGEADHVLQMIEFVLHDVTDAAGRIVDENPSGREHEGEDRFALPKPRVPGPEGLEPRNEHGHYRIYAPGPRELVFGRMKVDLSDVEQLLDSAQTKAVGLAVEYARRYMDSERTLKEVVDLVMSDIGDQGLDLLDPKFTGDLAAFRGFEFAAVLNRMRDFRVDPYSAVT